MQFTRSVDILARMIQLIRLVRLCLQVIGIVAIVVGFGLLFNRRVINEFTSGNWTDTDEQVVPSPHGLHFAKTFHRTSGPDESFVVALSTGNPNRSDEYFQIVEIRDVARGQASVAWDGTGRLLVNYPSTAKVAEAYAITHDVRVVLNPPLPSDQPSALER